MIPFVAVRYNGLSLIYHPGSYGGGWRLDHKEC